MAIPPMMMEVLRVNDNDKCCDCNALNPDWTSINLGIFLCIHCAGIHRNLGVEHSQVRSIDLDVACWDASRLAFMNTKGNRRAREYYEYCLPSYYARPEPASNCHIRENFVRAKYVRKEFIQKIDSREDPCIVYMPEKPRMGWIQKANEQRKFQKRWVVLMGRVIYVYNDADNTTPALQIDLKQATRVYSPEGINNMQRKFEFGVDANKQTHSFMCDTVEDLMGWIHALNRAVYYYNTTGHESPYSSDGERPVDLNKYSTNSPKVKESMLQVEIGQPPNSVGRVSGLSGKKYVLLTNKAILFFKTKPGDNDVPEMGIPLKGSEVWDCSSVIKRKFGFCLYKPGRALFFSASSLQEQDDWIKALREHVGRNLSQRPYDFGNPQRIGAIKNDDNATWFSFNQLEQSVSSLSSRVPAPMPPLVGGIPAVPPPRAVPPVPRAPLTSVPSLPPPPASLPLDNVPFLPPPPAVPGGRPTPPVPQPPQLPTPAPPTSSPSLPTPTRPTPTPPVTPAQPPQLPAPQALPPVPPVPQPPVPGVSSSSTLSLPTPPPRA